MTLIYENMGIMVYRASSGFNLIDTYNKLQFNQCVYNTSETNNNQVHRYLTLEVLIADVEKKVSTSNIDLFVAAHLVSHLKNLIQPAFRPLNMFVPSSHNDTNFVPDYKGGPVS